MRTLFLVIGCLTFCSPSTAQGPLPNVVLMMADDMGMGDCSAYQDFTGNSDDVQVGTPQMQRLANMGVRFTDAHTPSSRCTTTRYGLLTGRYCWRSRLKHFVLYGAQGDPLIEADRPTLASLFRDHGYATAMVGKWHVGLRYRQADGQPAAGWEDADLKQPMHTTPLDFGFDHCQFTSRSHGTSGPNAESPNAQQHNSANQTIGPGHVDGRRVLAATSQGKQLATDSENSYRLTQLGGRHSDHALAWLKEQSFVDSSQAKPFFLYYASNSNHSPYTPDDQIGGHPVRGQSRTVSGNRLDARHDFVYENDVALGRLLDFLETTNDPRQPGKKLIHNTLIIFTSDNGAEIKKKHATGPFRSNKGSCYEGGHRVPFLVSWQGGGIGDGNSKSPGLSSVFPVGLQDLFATFAEVLNAPLPDLARGEKGGEDSFSVLSAMRGMPPENRPVLFFNDHKESKDPAVVAMRIDSPQISGRSFPGQWKIFFDASLVRNAQAHALELYDLATDPQEKHNRIDEVELQPLVNSLVKVALNHRSRGGNRFEAASAWPAIEFDWRKEPLSGQSANGQTLSRSLPMSGDVTLTIRGVDTDIPSDPLQFDVNFRGLGLVGGTTKQVDDGEAIVLQFDRDVLVESIGIVAGNGTCGGYYQVGDHAPLAIYCIDADNDSREQHGIIGDVGVLSQGESLRLESRPHYGVEGAGRWRLQSLSVRVAPSRPIITPDAKR